jgi:L-ascorbate metabolism protein UlaG (beta-lactamase superfamily)
MMKPIAIMTLQITWLGHAAFLLQADMARVMLDPYRAPDAGTYLPIDTPADVVLVSHLNPKYHSHWDAALGSPVRLNGLDFAHAPEGVEAHGVRFRAIQVWESPARDVPVSMPYFTLGGVSVCHSGDLGHALSPAEASPIQSMDVFLAVAGGPPTVPILDLKAAIDLIRPRIVIPMHYQNGKVNLNLRPVDDLLALFNSAQVVRHPSPTLEVTPETLPAETQVVVLPSAR